MKTERTYTIFLVDDDALFLSLTEKALSKNKSYIVKTFLVGELCIANLDQNPDIIILDYYLNSKYQDADNGLKLLKEIKAIKPSINVIMLSGQEDLAIAVESIKYGAYDYIIKGVTAVFRVNYSILRIIEKIENNNEKIRDKKKTILLVVFLGLLLLFIIVSQILNVCDNQING